MKGVLTTLYICIYYLYIYLNLQCHPNPASSAPHLRRPALVECCQAPRQRAQRHPPLHARRPCGTAPDPALSPTQARPPTTAHLYEER